MLPYHLPSGSFGNLQCSATSSKPISRCSSQARNQGSAVAKLPYKHFRPLKKCDGNSLKLLDIAQKMWAPLRKRFAPPGVLSWLRAWFKLQPVKIWKRNSSLTRNRFPSKAICDQIRLCPLVVSWCRLSTVIQWHQSGRWRVWSND